MTKKLPSLQKKAILLSLRANAVSVAIYKNNDKNTTDFHKKPLTNFLTIQKIFSPHF